MTTAPHQKKTGLARIRAAFGYSLRGLRAVYVTEAAFRQELLLAAIMLPVAFLLPVTLAERLLLIASVVLVLIIEVLNSAIEAVVDRIGAEHHELAGKAKDAGSAAVFLALLLAGCIWGAVLVSAYLPEIYK